MTIYEVLTCARTPCLRSPAVMDGLEVLGVALEEDHPDSGGVKVDTKSHLWNGTHNSKPELDEDSFSLCNISP